VFVGKGRITLIDFDIGRQYNEHAEADINFSETCVRPAEQYGFSQTFAEGYYYLHLLRFC
jgi:hypothetical protein